MTHYVEQKTPQQMDLLELIDEANRLFDLADKETNARVLRNLIKQHNAVAAEYNARVQGKRFVRLRVSNFKRAA